MAIYCFEVSDFTNYNSTFEEVYLMNTPKSKQVKQIFLVKNYTLPNKIITFYCNIVSDNNVSSIHFTEIRGEG